MEAEEELDNQQVQQESKDKPDQDNEEQQKGDA